MIPGSATMSTTSWYCPLTHHFFGCTITNPAVSSISIPLIEQFDSSMRLFLEPVSEMVTHYEVRNQQSWRLEKRFEVENGYLFDTDIEHNHDARFVLSRVGFSADGSTAMLHLDYHPCCG